MSIKVIFVTPLQNTSLLSNTEINFKTWETKYGNTVDVCFTVHTGH